MWEEIQEDLEEILKATQVVAHLDSHQEDMVEVPLVQALVGIQVAALPVYLLEDTQLEAPLDQGPVATPVVVLQVLLQEDTQVVVHLVQAQVATPVEILDFLQEEDTQVEVPLEKDLVGSQVEAHLGVILQVLDHLVEDTLVVVLVDTQVEDFPVAAHLVDQAEVTIAKEDLVATENNLKQNLNQ